MVEKIKTLNTETDIGRRLRVEMRKKGISAAELARRAEVKTSFIYDVISGKSANPSIVKLSQVAGALSVSLAYLAGSASHPLLEEPFAPSPVGNGENYVTVQRLQVDVSTGVGVLISRFHKEERYYFRREWIENHLNVKAADLRLLFVRGDSMEPTLYHNDVILIDTSRKLPSPPGVFLLFDGFGLMAKRLEYVSSSEQARVRVISDNPQYSTYERAISNTAIVGRVIWFSREM